MRYRIDDIGKKEWLKLAEMLQKLESHVDRDARIDQQTEQIENLQATAQKFMDSFVEDSLKWNGVDQSLIDVLMLYTPQVQF